MPLHHAAVAKQRRTLAITFGELGSLSVTYDPSKVTPDFQQGLLDGAEEAKGIGEARIIAAVVTDWDYLDEKDKPFKLTFEVLKTLPMQILDRVVTEVFRDLNPPPAPSESSGSFS